MFSRTCFIAQFKEYSKSIQNSRKLLKQCDTKFSTCIILKKREIEEKQYVKFQKTTKLSPKLNSWRNLVKYVSRNRYQSLATAGLVSNLDDIPLTSSEKSDIVSSAADQTVAQILDSKSNVVEDAGLTSQIPTTEVIHAETEVVSQVNASNAEETLLSETLPEPPPIPDIPIEEFVEQLNALGQPTFASLGLGGWSPVGLVQSCFEYFNVTLGMPWWEAIILGTLIIRLCMFPLVVIAQRNAAKMNNNLPGLQAIQLKLTEARQCGNQLEAARYSQEMMLFMKEKNLNPLKNMIVPMAQMPVFISFFMGLRQMTNVPVESLKTGGLWWFTDLTLPDQFFIMPIITSLTLLATIELGTDAGKLSSQNLQTMKYVLRALPLVILPFTINFPGAILVYWTATNFVSLAQVGILKIPKVREYFRIEKHIQIDTKTLPIKPKGFTEGLKDSWSNMKVVKQLEERRRLDEIQFKRAGKGPVVKTYKYDPTKQTSPTSATAISAKKR